MFAHIDEKEELMAALLEMFMDASKSLLATDTEDKTAKNATWGDCVTAQSQETDGRGRAILLLQAVPRM